MKDKIVFWFFKAMVATLSLLPFSILFILSDIFCFFVRNIVRYRRKVVKQNLETCFPNMTDEERKKIDKQFYHYFCDMLMEGVKTYRMSYDEIMSRVSFENKSLITDYIDSGKNVILTVAHRGNWEWIPALYWNINNKDLVGGEFYRQTKNIYIDNLLQELRHRLGTITINKANPIREMIKLKQDKKIFAIGLINDQIPSTRNINFWTTFLGQETAFLSGPERISKMFKTAVIYVDVYRNGRSKYIYKLVNITDCSEKEEENFITQRYAELLEESILRDPADWLWSHRRWKHKRNKD